MTGNTMKKYALFGVFVVVILLITGRDQLFGLDTNFFQKEALSPSVDTSSSMNDQSRLSKIFSNINPLGSSRSDNDVVNDQCGISFNLPEGWVIEEVEEGERHCDYRIDNPYKRGATLRIGIPPTSSNEVSWDEAVSLLQTGGRNSTPITIDGEEGILFDMHTEEVGGIQAVGDPTYLVRKGSAVYYIRYGYYPAEDTMLQDISSVVSSFTFTRESSFYDTPMHNGQ